MNLKGWYDENRNLGSRVVEDAIRYIEHGESFPPVQGALGAALQEALNCPERPDGLVTQGKPIASNGNAVVLVSGGVDSTALYYWALKHYCSVLAFYVDNIAPYAAKEMGALHLMGVKYHTLPGRYFNVNWQYIHPARNLYYILLAAEQIGGYGSDLLFGVTAGEIPMRGGDKSAMFIAYTRELLRGMPYAVQLKTPFFNTSCVDVVRYWKENIPGVDITKTVSCFSGTPGQCGACRKCLRKALAFIANGMWLECAVDVRIGCEELIVHYKNMFLKLLKTSDHSRYSYERCVEDLKCLSMLERYSK